MSGAPVLAAPLQPLRPERAAITNNSISERRTRLEIAMSDPFKIVGEEWESPPAFADALRERLEIIKDLVERFGLLAEGLPETAYTDDEWRIVERAAHAVEEAAERADEGYVAVMYDSHAWYRIMESLDEIRARLASAIGVMDQIRGRTEAPGEAK